MFDKMASNNVKSMRKNLSVSRVWSGLLCIHETQTMYKAPNIKKVLHDLCLVNFHYGQESLTYTRANIFEYLLPHLRLKFSVHDLYACD